MEYVIFKNLSTPRKNFWELTGAVTFYESPVEIKQCQFINANSEDGLNIIRSAFSISNSLFESTLSDALDIDFSKGEIINSFFHKAGNDAIDVSGTSISLRNINIGNAGDKGIIVGEGSKLTMNQIFIDNCKIGIAAKDLSEIRGKDISISNSIAGIALYQKKHEFGPSLAHLKKVTIKKTKHKHFIESASELKINRKRKRTDQDTFENFKKELLDL